MSKPTSDAIGAIIKSILANAILAAVKIVTGVIGNSYALIADGIESVNDIIASGVILVSLKIASKPPDEDHPYGHGKAEQMGALFSSISLLAAGGMIAYQSIQNLVVRHHSPEWFTLPVLFLVIVTKEILSRYALRKSGETSSSALKSEAWHHRSDAITSGAAFIGIVIALIGGPGYEKADDVAALIGCLVIGINGFKLLKDATHEIMDGSPDASVIEEVRKIALTVPDVRLVEKLRMKKIGLGYFMDLHVQVDSTMTVEEGHQVAHAVATAIRLQMPQANDVVTHVEPYYTEVASVPKLSSD